MIGRLTLTVSSLALAVSAVVVAGATSSAAVMALRPVPAALAVAPADRGVAADVARARGLRDLGRVAASKSIQIGLLMQIRNLAQLEQLIVLQSDRRSPLFHHYLSPAQFAAYFSPDSQTYARTINTLERRGFHITQVFPNRAFIRAEGSAAMVERYFSTELHSVVQPGHGVRYENVRPAVMPQELRNAVIAVAGLHSVVTMRHSLEFANPSIVRHSAYYARALADVMRAKEAGSRRRIQPIRRHPDNVPTPLGTTSPAPNPSPDATIVPGDPATEYTNSIGGYGPDIYVNAYDYPVQHGYGGSHHAAGSVIEADFLNSDMNAEFTAFGIPRTAHAYRVCPDPAGGPTCYNTIGQPDPIGESTLDALTIMSMAPAADFFEYLAPAFDDLAIETAYEYAVNQDAVDAVNSSFGGCETDDPSFGYATNYIAMEGASLGISFEASTGDTGATNCGTYATNGAPQTEVNTSLPSSDIYFTAVGGTDFYPIESCSGVGSSCYTRETAWTFGGGGYSVFNPVQSWQAPLLAGQPVTSVGSQTMRNTPDVVFTADELPPGVGIAIYYNGADSAIGGTSVASPMWTALQVEINQVQDSRNGLVGPGLYAVAANSALYAYAFRDIIGGTNEHYTAIPGYDDASGIGSPLGWELAGVENGTPGATAAPATASPGPTPTPVISPSPSPSPTPVIVPSPVGTSFAVTTIAGNGAALSMDSTTGTTASFDGPTGIIYIPAAASGLDTQSATDNYLFVNDFTTGFLRSMDLTTTAVVTEENRTWNNAARASMANPEQASNLYGLAYLPSTGAEGATWGALYVISGGDDNDYEVSLPTSPDPASTPMAIWKNLSGGTSAAVWDALGENLANVSSNDDTLHIATFVGASGLDLTASTELPAKGNFGITNDGAAAQPTFAITDSGMNEVLTATDVPGTTGEANTSTVATLASGAPLKLPKEIVYVSSLSAFFVANCGGNNIIRVSSSGAMSVAAGDGAARELNGNNTGAEFNCPFGITTDGATPPNLYVTDLGGNTVRMISKLQ